MSKNSISNDRQQVQLPKTDDSVDQVQTLLDAGDSYKTVGDSTETDLQGLHPDLQQIKVELAGSADEQLFKEMAQSNDVIRIVLIKREHGNVYLVENYLEVIVYVITVNGRGSGQAYESYQIGVEDESVVVLGSVLFSEFPEIILENQNTIVLKHKILRMIEKKNQSFGAITF